jgi:hypothetical protein
MQSHNLKDYMQTISQSQEKQTETSLPGLKIQMEGTKTGLDAQR